MAKETEIKLRISDLRVFQRALKRLGVQTATAGRVHEWNVIFDTPERGLARQGKLLRIRTETSEKEWKKRGMVKNRVLVTFKSPVERGIEALTVNPEEQRYKVREELELEVAEAAMMTRIFEGLGMQGWFTYEKYRTTYHLPGSKRWGKGLLIEQDETSIGKFVELEGPPEAIDRAAQELGFSKQDYILKNYMTLYFEDCSSKGVEPSNMVFEEARKP